MGVSAALSCPRSPIRGRRVFTPAKGVIGRFGTFRERAENRDKPVIPTVIPVFGGRRKSAKKFRRPILDPIELREHSRTAPPRRYAVPKFKSQKPRSPPSEMLAGGP